MTTKTSQVEAYVGCPYQAKQLLVSYRPLGITGAAKKRCSSTRWGRRTARGRSRGV